MGGKIIIRSSGIIVVLLAILVAAGCMGPFERALEVETISPRRGELRESFREPAKTRLENTWRIAAQISGRIGRIELEPGDRVKKGQVLAEFDLLPFETAIREAEASIDQLEAQLALIDDDTLDLTALSEAEAMAQSTADSVEAAQARLSASEVRVRYMLKELERITDLAENAAPRDLDEARLSHDTAREQVRADQSDLASQRSLLSARRLAPRRIRETIERKKIQRQENTALVARAEAQLEAVKHERELATIVSPIDGIVLERYERGEKPLAAGTDLLLLGKPSEIEVIADVLTEDALRLTPGAEVALESMSVDLTLMGRVKRIQPQGFTKYSSLGVEEQRVNVIIEIDDPPPSIVEVGYRLYARFHTGYRDDALIIPFFSVLQALDQSFYVLVIEEGKLRRQSVKIGLRSDQELEAVEGLTENSIVVATPDSTMEEGMRVRARK